MSTNKILVTHIKFILLCFWTLSTILPFKPQLLRNRMFLSGEKVGNYLLSWVCYASDSQLSHLCSTIVKTKFIFFQVYFIKGYSYFCDLTSHPANCKVLMVEKYCLHQANLNHPISHKVGNTSCWCRRLKQQTKSRNPVILIV
jgi:hypothetical protein